MDQGKIEFWKKKVADLEEKVEMLQLEKAEREV